MERIGMRMERKMENRDRRKEESVKGYEERYKKAENGEEWERRERKKGNRIREKNEEKRKGKK